MSLPVLKTADTDELLNRIDPELVRKGCLHVLAVDAIRERSGRRWPTRQDTVWEFAERQFQKDFSPADHLLRLDDANFLLLQPLQTSHGAQGAALKLLREVLAFFLGTTAKADVKLSQVTGIGPNGIEHAAVQVSDAEFAALSAPTAAAAPEPELPTQEPADQHEAGPPGLLASVIDGGRQTTPRVLSGDRTYELLFVLEPLWGVRNRAVVSHRLKPLIFERLFDGTLEQANLRHASVKDLVRLDLIVLTEAQRLIRQEGEGRRFALHVPIHHATLTTTAGRQAALWALEQLQPLASSFVVICVKGLEPGAPHSRLVEVTSMLKGRCRAVIAQAPGFSTNVERWRGAQLSGVSLDLDELGGLDTSVNQTSLGRFAVRAQGVAPALIAYSISDRPTMLSAWAAGFTHLSGELIFQRLKEPLTPVRFEPHDLYGERKVG